MKRIINKPTTKPPPPPPVQPFKLNERSITMCDFCSKIWESEEEYHKQFQSHWDEFDAIIMNEGKPWLYITCEDNYYSACVIELNYCPKCGRKLINEEE